jgi:Fe-S-cluster containining protein
LVDYYEKTLPENDFNEFMVHINQLHEKYRAEISSYSPGPERARAIHQLMNEEINKTLDLQISCQKGCGHCCHLEVEILKDEGELLALVVLDGHSINHNRLEIQASRERKSSDWQPIIQPVNKCVFLDSDNACSVYEHRPSSCRKHLVTSPVAECIAPNGNPQPVSIPLAELILSTAMSLSGNTHASLSKSVKAGLEKYAHMKNFKRIQKGSELTLA